MKWCKARIEDALGKSELLSGVNLFLSPEKRYPKKAYRGVNAQESQPDRRSIESEGQRAYFKHRQLHQKHPAK